MVIVKRARRERMVVRGARFGGGVMIDAGVIEGEVSTKRKCSLNTQ